MSNAACNAHIQFGEPLGPDADFMEIADWAGETLLEGNFWRPISTAPEGVEVMLWRASGGCWWGKQHYDHVSSSLYWAVRYGDGWLAVADVTHWQPVPSQPGCSPAGGA